MKKILTFVLASMAYALAALINLKIELRLDQNNVFNDNFTSYNELCITFIIELMELIA